MRDEGPTGPPPLPPSPMTQVAEPLWWGEVRLPWSTMLFAILAGGLAAVLILPLEVFWPGTGFVAFIGFFGTTTRAALLAFAAVVADRAAPSWPRSLRWGLAMLLFGLIPGVEQSFRYPWSTTEVCWLLAAAARDGCLGLLLGVIASSQAGLWWRLPLAGVGAMLTYVVADYTLVGPLGGLVEAPYIAPDLAVSCAALVIGCYALLGLVFAWRLRVASGPRMP
jgi:hypothetical protein